MNILQLICSKGLFGAENVMLQLASELQTMETCTPIVGVFENHHSPHLEMAEACRKQTIESAFFPCRGKFDFKTILQLRRFVQKEQIDIIHSHGYKSNIYSFLASCGLTTRRVATCHNWLGDDPKMKSYAVLDRCFLRRFDKIVAVSDDVRKCIVSSGVRAEKVTIVRNGISLERFDGSYSVAGIRNELGIPLDVRVIGTVGRISEEKGHGYLLNVVSAIVERFPKTVFLLVGDGPLRKQLQAEYDSPSVIFTGMRYDLPELYNCMDVFVLPSLTEGLPLVLLEAMASGLPAIATRVGAIPTIIAHMKNGLLVEPADETSIEDAIVYLFSNPGVAREMGQGGHRRVKEHFSSRKMVRDYMNVYRELIQENRSPL